MTFADCVSDSFDGDFVTGTLRSCTFRDGLADGADFSGSEVVLEDCSFVNLADKGVSVGERSNVRITGGRARDVGIGVASKDGSTVEVEAFEIENARHYALAAFIKKASYGPSTLNALDVAVLSPGRGPALAQTGCTLRIDGVLQTTEDLDVERLYAEGVLGR